MTDEHRRDQKVETIFAILVVSDTRTKATDTSGQIASEILTSQGHSVKTHDIVKNDTDEIERKIGEYIDDSEIRVIITSGGTGVGKRDLTAGTLEPMFDKILKGFGEHFRRVSFEEIGLAGIYSRATAGLIGKKVVFSLPGSKNAMRTAMNDIILPSIGHLLWEIDR